MYLVGEPRIEEPNLRKNLSDISTVGKQIQRIAPPRGEQESQRMTSTPCES